MPGSYLFEFTAHIDERKRPEGFPKKVFVREQYQDLPDEEVKNLYNQRVKSMVTAPGIVVFLDDHEIILTDLSFDQRTYIPWHMITHFGGRAVVITPKPEPTPLEALFPPNGPAPQEAKKETVQ
jgi:hypothetical protein